MGSKQQGGRPPLHATHPSHGPPATHNLYLHEIARSCISNTHKKKKLEEPPYAHVICPCVSGWGCRLQVGGRVLISRDDDWRNFLIIAHFLSRCALLAGWLSWSPRIRRRAFRRQAGSKFSWIFGLWTGPTGDITTHRIINAFFIFCFAPHGR